MGRGDETHRNLVDMNPLDMGRGDRRHRRLFAFLRLALLKLRLRGETFQQASRKEWSSPSNVKEAWPPVLRPYLFVLQGVSQVPAKNKQTLHPSCVLGMLLTRSLAKVD